MMTPSLSMVTTITNTLCCLVWWAWSCGFTPRWSVMIVMQLCVTYISLNSVLLNLAVADPEFIQGRGITRICPRPQIVLNHTLTVHEQMSEWFRKMSVSFCQVGLVTFNSCPSTLSSGWGTIPYPVHFAAVKRGGGGYMPLVSPAWICICLVITFKYLCYWK